METAAPGRSGTAALCHFNPMNGIPKLGGIGAMGAPLEVIIDGNSFNACRLLEIRKKHISNFADNSIGRFQTPDFLQSFDISFE